MKGIQHQEGGEEFDEIRGHTEKLEDKILGD